mmetsp:Transcript_36099/g.90832  ORF Transcript_36099/g.90832 Transcript_36099/m.90832 type:complete len:232 (+) Transcript_36099:266-961(+)
MPFRGWSRRWIVPTAAVITRMTIVLTVAISLAKAVSMPIAVVLRIIIVLSMSFTLAVAITPPIIVTLPIGVAQAMAITMAIIALTPAVTTFAAVLTSTMQLMSRCTNIITRILRSAPVAPTFETWRRKVLLITSRRASPITAADVRKRLMPALIWPGLPMGTTIVFGLPPTTTSIGPRRPTCATIGALPIGCVIYAPCDAVRVAPSTTTSTAPAMAATVTALAPPCLPTEL